MIIYGYHGTTKENALSIVRTRYFYKSRDERDWLGHGVYFFINEHKDKAIEQSKKWALRKNAFYAVIEAEIRTDKNRTIDLDEQEWYEAFQEVREYLVKEVIERGFRIYDDSRKLDCYVIDMFCKRNNIAVVIKKVFINFMPYYENTRVASSFIPNCRIMCIKDARVINKNSIKIVKEGMKNG